MDGERVCCHGVRGRNVARMHREVVRRGEHE